VTEEQVQQRRCLRAAAEENAGVLAVAIVGVAAAGATAAQAVSGFGLSLVLAPIVQAVSPGAGAVRLVAVFAGAANAVLLGLSWRAARWRRAVLILVPGMATALALSPVLSAGSNRTVSVAAALGTLASIGLALRRRPPRWLSGIGGALVAGVLSGALTVASGAGGGPVAAHVATQKWNAREYVATAQLIFLPVNLAAAFALQAPVPHGLLEAAAVGGVVGIALGHWLRDRLSAESVRRAVLVVATAGSALILVRAATGGG
jgi:uncharacterized membrane protein YfcA